MHFGEPDIVITRVSSMGGGMSSLDRNNDDEAGANGIPRNTKRKDCFAGDPKRRGQNAN